MRSMSTAKGVAVDMWRGSALVGEEETCAEVVAADMDGSRLVVVTIVSVGG